MWRQSQEGTIKQRRQGLTHKHSDNDKNTPENVSPEEKFEECYPRLTHHFPWIHSLC